MDGEQRQSMFISTNMKNNIAQFLMKKSHDGVLTKGAVKEASSHFQISRKTTSRIWKAALEQMRRGQPVHMVGKVRGYHHEDKLEIDEQKVRSLSMLERSSIRKMAGNLEVSKSILGDWVKQQKLKPHTNAIKPVLTEKNKIARLRWCLSQLQPKISEGKVPYHTMHNVIHIDEKWFYMTKSTDRYYLLPDEDEPYRSCKNKRFITKVMFMCAVSRPEFGTDGQTLFDGKIGIFPFTEKVPAKRNSKNRSKGTMETKPIASVTKAVTKELIIQDNAKPHISPSDEDFQAVANSDGFKIHLICQPPNSPDSNILDLGFFNAIQSLQYEKPCKTVDELVANVFSSFEELSPQTLNKVFLSLQNCLTEILKVKGGNNYKVPHMKKNRLERIGGLPNVLEVEEGLLREVVEYLQLPQNKDISCYDISSLTETLGY